MEELKAKRDIYQSDLKHLKDSGIIKTSKLLNAKYNTNSSKIKKVKSKIHQVNRKIVKEKFFLNDHIHDVLMSENQNFKRISDESLKLIEGKEIVFRNNKTRYHMLTSHTKGFYGEMESNGYIRCEAYKLSLNLFGIGSNVYPMGYTGTINSIGQIGLRINKYDFDLSGGRVPTKFIGKISAQGKVDIKTKESYREFGGAQYVNNLIGKVQFNDPDEENKFTQNKRILFQMIEEYYDILKKEY